MFDNLGEHHIAIINLGLTAKHPLDNPHDEMDFVYPISCFLECIPRTALDHILIHSQQSSYDHQHGNNLATVLGSMF